MKMVRVPIKVSSGQAEMVEAWRYTDRPTVVYVGIRGATLKLIVRPIKRPR